MAEQVTGTEPGGKVPEGSGAEGSGAESRGRRYACDFCGSEVDRVRRVALDRDYDRLGVRHPVRYACDSCSERKESERKPATG